MTGPDSGPESGPDLVLRPALPADVDRLAEVLLACGEPEPGHDDLAERVAAAGRGEREVWVAEGPDGSPAVGFVDLHGAWVSQLFVTPAAQRHGVGRALLELAQGLCPDGLELRVHARNETARLFYRALGLVELERTDGSDHADAEPDVRMAWPGHDPLGHWRAAIDDVDADLAVLLARRFALAGAVQDLKHATQGAGGHAGRDPGREAAIVSRMARLAPGVPPERLARVVEVVLEEGLEAWEAARR